MELFKRILRKGKIMILTIPVGQDQVYSPLHRVYGEERLPKLLRGWEVLREEYWAKDENNCWNQVDMSEALTTKPKGFYYCLGLFVLREWTRAEVY